LSVVVPDSVPVRALAKLLGFAQAKPQYPKETPEDGVTGARRNSGGCSAYDMCPFSAVKRVERL
jgi:hypothetical protein